MASFKGKTALVLGGTGYLGSGAVYQFLQEGAVVVVVSRTEDKIKELIAEVGGASKDQLIGVTGSFTSKKDAEATYAKVKAALKGASPDHVVSAMGFSTMTPTGITGADVSALTESFNQSMFPALFAAQVIVADLKDKEGASYTILNGGLQHGAFWPGAWAATVNSSALNGVFLSLLADIGDAKLRINQNCLHFSAAKPGMKTNQLGAPIVMDGHAYGRTFTKLAKMTDTRGQRFCFSTKEEVEAFL